MLTYLPYLIIFLAIPCQAMDQAHCPLAPAVKEVPGQSYAILGGRGKFSPDGTKILVRAEKEEDGRIKNDGLYIHDISTGSHQILENSASAELRKNLSNSGCHFFSWSPQGTLIKARYFTQTEKIVQKSGYGQDREYALPLNVLKIWNKDGKLLYRRHISVGAKAYFTAHDEYLLVKEEKEPLRVFDAQTAKQLAVLGQPSYTEQRMAIDPQSEWILQADKDGTDFYDLKQLGLIHQVAARVDNFTSDGTLFTAEEIKEYDESTPETCIYEGGKYLAYFCTVYNRQLQKMGRFNVGWASHFDISPSQKTVIAYEFEEENHFDLTTVQKKDSFDRKRFSYRSEFSNTDCTQKIVLIHDETNKSTLITCMEKGKQDKSFQFPCILNHVCYTPMKQIIALAYYDRIKYLFNPQTGIATPCIINLTKSLFKRKPIDYVNQNGYYIAKTDTGYELRRLPDQK